MNQLRLPQTSIVKLIVTIVTAVFTIILFNDTAETPQGVQNRNGALFFMTMTIAFNAVQSIIYNQLIQVLYRHNIDIPRRATRVFA